MNCSSIDCIVCQEPYSDDRLPRNLTCGHSFCTTCLQVIVKESKFCPECRTTINVYNVSALPVNYPLLRLTESIRVAQRKSSGLHKYEVNDPSKTAPTAPAAPEVQAGDTCQKHGCLVTFLCITCKVWICRGCMISDHLDPPRGSCQFKTSGSALEEMKTSHKHTQSLLHYPSKVKSMRMVLEKETVVLNSREKYFKGKIQELQSQQNSVTESLAELHPQKERIVTRLANLQEVSDTMEHSKSLVDRAASVKEFEGAMETLANSLEVLNNFEAEEKARGPVVQRILLNATDNLFSLLKSGITVYTSLEIRGRKKLSPIAIRDDQIVVYSLREEKAPFSGVVIPFESVRALIPESSPTVFLEVSWRGQARGRIFITMLGNKARHLQTLFLCSGELGPSYRNTIFHSFSNQYMGLYDILSGGDYENNDGSGGPAIVEGITDGGFYKHQIIAGLVAGCPSTDVQRLGGFNIYLNDVLEEFDFTAIGVVTTGLHVLQTSARMLESAEVSISECGIAIPVHS